jgi:hypothetical protein
LVKGLVRHFIPTTSPDAAARAKAHQAALVDTVAIPMTESSAANP